MAKKVESHLKISPSKENFVTLTIPEFLDAGDCLLIKCPICLWESGDASKQKTYLPAHKQFLILRDVPYTRMTRSFEEDYVFLGGGGDEVDTRRLIHGDPRVPYPRMPLSSDGRDGDEVDARRLIHGDPSESKNDDKEELPEAFMENHIVIIHSHFVDDNEEETPYMELENSICPATQESTQPVVHDPEDNICARKYDISITYDEDCNAPHFWLIGYHQDGRILQPELILDNVRQNHVGKTVTMEDHPCLPGKHASVHPIVHGAAVKKMVDSWTSRGIVVEVDKYLFLCLEFVSLVFPFLELNDTIDPIEQILFKWLCSRNVQKSPLRV